MHIWDASSRKQIRGRVSPQEKNAKKLALDEQTFQQLLESAYVLQKHNDQAAASHPSPLAPDPLGEIVETQRLIQNQRLELADAAELIVERARVVVHASGSAIGIVERDQLIYSSASGNARDEAGSRVPGAQSVAAPVLLANSNFCGKILMCPDVSATPELNAEIYRARGIRSLILVPVQYDGKVEAVLELHSDRTDAFDDQDVRRAELMASLLREAIARAAEMEWKQTLAAERSNMLQAMDAIQPQIERLVSPAGTENPESTALPEVPAMEFSAASFTSEAEPVFSSSRFADEVAPFEPVAQEMPPDPFPVPPASSDGSLVHAATEKAPPTGSTSAPNAKSPWASADSTWQWLETLRPRKSNVLWWSRQWQTHRANFYLTLSALLLLAVLSGWGTHSSNTGVSANTATAAKAQPTKPQLTLFEKGLIAFGLADPPPTPPDMG